MYARLARFARRCFHITAIGFFYMTMQDEQLHDMAHLHMLLMYGGEAILSQIFVVVEQLDRGLCVEET